MEYLIATSAVGLLWAVCFVWRKDLRYRMLWAGLLYTVVMTVGFFAVRLLWHVPEYQTINPGYWSPDSLFDLNRIMGGFSIEDVFFMFFFGGLVGVMFELLMRRPPLNTFINSGIKVSIPLATLTGVLVTYLGLNLMYSIITFGLAGAFVIWLQRPDLLRRSLIGGFAFLVLYTGLYLVFLFFFPSFVALYYHLENVSSTLIIGIPLEEYLYAFGFGSMWSVIYPYMRNTG